MSKKTLWITRTAVLVALLVGLQFATRSLGQFVTGSCVNLVLTVAVLCGGWWCGLTVALLSPLFAFLVGVGPALVQLVPAIALGNAALTAVLWLLGRRAADSPGAGGRLRGYAAAVCAALVKFAVLYLVVVKLLLPALGLPEAKAAAMSAMFSWPQLVTALIGGVLGVTAAPLVNRAARR